MVRHARWILAVGVLCGTGAGGVEEEVPAVDKVIAPAVAGLPDPQTGAAVGGLRMALSAASEQAQEHVLRGLNLALANWDFEAYRHFCAALKLDPECLMAHWGIGLTLAEPGNEFSAQRNAAVARMAWLAQKGAGTELERGYAYGMIVFYRDGAAPAGDTFRKLGERYPNEVLAKLLGALFGRGGYDEFGDATPDQERAEKLVQSLMAMQPGNPLLAHAWLVLRAEGPVTDADLELARDMCQRVPEMPTYQHALGHFEWRNGNAQRAGAAFGRAAAAYEVWRRQEGVPIADCPGWVKAESYRAVALAGAGDLESALASARALAAMPLDVKRAAAPGTRMMWWEARTLTARLLAARNGPGDAAAGLESLPKPEEVKPFASETAVRWYLQGLALLFEGRKALLDKDLERARQIAGLMTDHGAKMAETREQAAAGGELSYWLRAFRALEVMAAEFRGDLALAGPAGGRGSAYNWYLAAADRQVRASMMMPPVILVPMRMRLGDYLAGRGKKVEAVEAYRRALDEWPSHRRTMEQLAKISGNTGSGGSTQRNGGE